MPQISPALAVEPGLRFTELHLLDGGGRPQLILELTPEQCLALAEQLKTLRPIEIINVKAVEVVEEPIAPLETPVAEPEAPAEVDLDPLPSDAVLEEIPVGVDEGPFPSDAQVAEAETRKPIDWAGMTKAEIVETVYDRFGVDLDLHDKKDDLIAQAVALESSDAK